MGKAISKKDFAEVVEALGQKPTCLFVSVGAEVKPTDPLDERETVPGIKVVHVHTDDYDGPCSGGVFPNRQAGVTTENAAPQGP